MQPIGSRYPQVDGTWTRLESSINPKLDARRVGPLPSKKVLSEEWHYKHENIEALVREHGEDEIESYCGHDACGNPFAANKKVNGETHCEQKYAGGENQEDSHATKCLCRTPQAYETKTSKDKPAEEATEELECFAADRN